MLRNFIQTQFPQFASTFRRIRDNRIEKNRRFVDCSEGFKFIGDLDLESSRTESHELSTFKTLLAETDLVIDIGANAGFFALVAARSGTECIAVEANPQNFRLLLKNIRENECDSIEPVFAALNSKTQVTELFGGGQGASLLKNWGGMKSTYSHLVYSTTLDRLLQYRAGDRRLLIKLDVEGAEHLVLSGATETLGRHPSPAWIVEHGFSENFDGSINPHFRNVFELFWKNDYTARTIEANPRVVTHNDVDEWLQRGERGFGWMYYTFTRDETGK